MVLPAHLSPFVLPIETRAAVRHGAVDLYLPEADEARPAIVFIHGWVSKEQEPPRTWPLFQGYGSLAASRGVVGVTVDHRLYGPTGYQLAAADGRGHRQHGFDCLDHTDQSRKAVERALDTVLAATT